MKSEECKRKSSQRVVGWGRPRVLFNNKAICGKLGVEGERYGIIIHLL